MGRGSSDAVRRLRRDVGPGGRRGHGQAWVRTIGEWIPDGWSTLSGQPEIRYVASADGTRLAVSAHGSGAPLVFVTLHLGDRLGAPNVASRHLHRDLVAHCSLVRFDGRGCGLSDRSPAAL